MFEEKRPVVKIAPNSLFMKGGSWTVKDHKRFDKMCREFDDDGVLVKAAIQESLVAHYQNITAMEKIDKRNEVKHTWTAIFVRKFFSSGYTLSAKKISFRFT